MNGTRQLADVLAEADSLARHGVPFVSRPLATGFSPLDEHLSGGIRTGELALIGGPQGLGKTTFALQMARNMAAAGATVAYLCYEHDERVLLQRLIAMEAGLLAGDLEPPSLPQISEALALERPDAEGLPGRLRSLPLAAQAVDRIGRFGERLRLVRASGRSTGLQEIREMAANAGVLFVDYLQKVSTAGYSAPNEDERVTLVVEGLKDIAMEYNVAVVAIAAADKSGIGEGRTRLHQLRGSTALAYECDIALMLNDKWHVVARHHLMYDTVNAARYRDWVVCTIDKNRAGKADVDLEFRKRFMNAHFDPEGNVVREELIDDRVFRE